MFGCTGAQRQVPPNSAKFRQVPPKCSPQHRCAPPSSAKLRVTRLQRKTYIFKLPPSSAKFRQIPAGPTLVAPVASPRHPPLGPAPVHGPRPGSGVHSHIMPGPGAGPVLWPRCWPGSGPWAQTPIAFAPLRGHCRNTARPCFEKCTFALSSCQKIESTRKPRLGQYDMLLCIFNFGSWGLGSHII